MTVPVVSARQAADRDASAIQAGTPSIDLMRRAGFGAANVLRARFAQLAPKGVVVFVGAGNNGGDGWVVAGTLVREGIPVRVVEVVPSRSADAQLARDSALPLLASSASFGEPAIVVDALLGTGASGPLRSPIAEAVAQLHDLRSKGVKIVALDLPTGVDASNGNVAAGGVVADLTVSFGTVKRGQLVARANCGEIVVIDIGLGGHAHLRDGAPNLLDAARFHASVPSFGADAHKGTRKKLLVVGGAYGMAGAAALAARAALRSGIGMVRLCVAHESVVPLQSGVLEATTTPWPTDDATLAIDAQWADVLLIGPGLGAGTREMVERWLRATTVPVVLDADGLNAFAGDAESLGKLLRGRPAIVTPHVAEFGRLTNRPVAQVLDERWDVGLALARTLDCVVLLKGVPTIISAPDGRLIVSATGTPALATAGSGDMLGGVIATLLAQFGEPSEAAACGAWAHGRAAELAGAGRSLRGVELADVMNALPFVWKRSERLSTDVIARLPRIGDDDD